MIRVYIAHLILLGISLGLFICVAIVFYWAYKNNQFEDIERPKYEMLEDCTDETNEWMGGT